MNLSQVPFKTLKTVEDEHLDTTMKLLLRGGYIRRIEKHQYALLPLGKLMVEKIRGHVSAHLNRDKYIEIDTMYGGDGFIKRLTKFIMPDIKSYKDLPQGYYQISKFARKEKLTKQRLIDGSIYEGIDCIKYYDDEESSKKDFINITKKLSTLLGCFNIDSEIIHNYNKSIPYENSISIGTTKYSGIDIYKCSKCGYNIARDILSNNGDIISYEEEVDELEALLTKDIKTIEELKRHLDIDSKELAKTLLLKVDGELIAVVIRGDRDLNIKKLSKYLNKHIDDISMAEQDDIEMNLDTVVGFVGPVELSNIRILVDQEVSEGGYITGANKRDYHLKNVVHNRDYVSDGIGDFIYHKPSPCNCGEDLVSVNIHPIIDIDYLGLIKEPRAFKYKDAEGNTKDIYGVYYGVDLIRLMYIIADNNRDDKGIVWPKAIAPFDVLITIMNIKKAEQLERGIDLGQKLSRDINILIDDRNVGAGAKFFDSELWGIPMRITIGKKIEEDMVEVKYRNEEEQFEVSIKEAIELVLKNYNAKA